MADFGCDRSTAAVHRYDNVEARTTPSEFARKTPALEAAMAHLTNQPIKDPVMSADSKKEIIP